MCGGISILLVVIFIVALLVCTKKKMQERMLATREMSCEIILILILSRSQLQITLELLFSEIENTSFLVWNFGSDCTSS